jgi:dihydroflavonol-4-reductase
MPTAFVTGATGLLGSNLVRELVQQGYQVKALVRSLDKAQRILGDLPVTFVQGDLGDIPAFAPAMAGCDVLFHTAAYFREYYQPGDHWALLQRYNIDGTLQILEAAEAHGVKKAIYTSSSGVIDKASGNESSGPNPTATHNLYFKSKVIAEERVKAFCQSHHLPVVMILPGWMLGPGDEAPTASGQLILDAVQGKLPGYFEGGTSTVDARDVATAMVAAVEHGQPGERYIVAGKYVSMQDMMQAIERVTGVKAPRRRFPKGLMLLVAALMENKARLTRKPSVMSVDGVKTMMDQHQVNSERAIRELKIQFRPLDESIRDEVLWFVQHQRLNLTQMPKFKTEKQAALV